MTYSIGEISKMLNISISALRYYDKEGLLPLVNRTPGNIRISNNSLNGVKKEIQQLNSDMIYSFIKKKKLRNILLSYKMHLTESIINVSFTE
ncbi:MAG: MerR family DNA-binding transcriptional regulator [Clostridium sp.]|jgi:DNA-binding transcriptional MerR regulator|uniref:MerR family DNA-binding transcriptional regulator n=1 Tax=Clostridium sp. TaxID=1506 RepID=UPI0025BD366D|nr:MerR family DNA-binding transcriptional regulator [Clostridium sp.]MCH3964517.1 MerR family DNA-binding transcriptional regulator [Clostridium sp.]MCI1714989.1 MerR family DNA-binding transcriptional regulator [Clostridium sp.]MCI1799251.1 MerR family DNA-binding transcriptional regulator [Clostridium sp.]MCI1813172.1 MerR family DNA-binding transcriptional regulator [Clostridium sp.]MCI1870062.1 MerR family DNA-binding transcriptional regulator [Clostridium sp.]